MITVIAGTNRPESRTALIADVYSKILTKKGVEHKLLRLKDLPKSFFHENMYKEDGLSHEMIALQEEFILKSNKFFMIIPEYNGGIPGVFKTFIDAMCARKYKENFSGKKISLTGVAAGRAGNLRGLEALTGILNYLGAIILPNKLPLSSIENSLVDDEATPNLVETITSHIEQHLRF